MTREVVSLYGGKTKANSIGSFMKEGFAFDIIRPGLDAQGRKRLAWTQFVFEGVPVFEVKIKVDLKGAMKKFDELWGQHIGEDRALAKAALERAKQDRTSKFQDGVTGESAAPAVSQDGRTGKIYSG